MSKVIVYKVKLYDVTTDESRVSRRMATEKGAAKMHGEIIRATEVEIEADRLEPGEECRGYGLSPQPAYGSSPPRNTRSLLLGVV
jgi:hypothetical protein